MRIAAVRSYIKKIKLTQPYTIAYSTFSDVEIVFFEIELNNGIVGYGTASPAEEVVGENSQQTFLNLQSDFVQNMVGRDICHFQSIIHESRLHFFHLPGTQAAIDLALHDAFCKFLHISVAQFYGIKQGALPTSITIGIKPLDETLEDAKKFESQGFKIIKLKMGLEVEEDIEKMLQLHAHFSNKIKIRVDPNQGYTLQDLKKFLKATSHTPVELIEQPLPVGKELDLLDDDIYRKAILMADESLQNAKSALDFSQAPQPFEVFNIKLMKCGGIISAMEIANIAQHGGIDLFWGCNDESVLSITAALHAAYACTNTKYIDLDGSFDLQDDVMKGGFVLKDGYMYINNQPGFGVELN
ncbi:MAG: dipeptide epimerase [Chitinophagaceae bacterium]|jgi:L-alanine-DL-glutamate epimerase-like enolase superfamily enzyme|nr:MAG: dipeptide epimerase [Chitinophagaceae bacterium]